MIEQYNINILKFKNCPYRSIKYCLLTDKDGSYDNNIKLDIYEEKEIYKVFEDFCNTQKLFKIYLDLIIQISTTRQDYNKLSIEEKEQFDITHNLAKYISQSLQLKKYNADGIKNANYVKNNLLLSIASVRAEIKYNISLSQYHLASAIESIDCILNEIKK